ncbi:MAG: type II toxin-antitoxin system VapC family toxin [Terriglobia bacterium]
MNVFLDSSALAKRYVNEVGSDQVEEILSAASSLGLSEICLSEVISGLCRLRREGKLSPPQYAENKRALIQDVEASVVIYISDQVVARAVRLLEHWPLRSSDALHVACAAEWAADLFVSADERQCKAARGHGLRVEALGAG